MVKVIKMMLAVTNFVGILPSKNTRLEEILQQLSPIFCHQRGGAFKLSS